MNNCVSVQKDNYKLCPCCALPCSHPQLSQLQTSDVAEIINQLELSLFILTNISQIDNERRCEANHLSTEGLGVPTSAYLQVLFLAWHAS